MFLVRDVCLIEAVERYTFGSMRCPELLDEIGLEHARGTPQSTFRINSQYFSYMKFSLCVALEAIFVPALLLADLTIPSERLESSAAHLIRNLSGRSHLRS